MRYRERGERRQNETEKERVKEGERKRKSEWDGSWRKTILLNFWLIEFASLSNGLQDWFAAASEATNEDLELSPDHWFFPGGELTSDFSFQAERYFYFFPHKKKKPRNSNFGFFVSCVGSARLTTVSADWIKNASYIFNSADFINSSANGIFKSSADCIKNSANCAAMC